MTIRKKTTPLNIIAYDDSLEPGQENLGVVLYGVPSLSDNNTFTGSNTFEQNITAPNINGAPTITATEITSKGGLLKCIDSATGDIAITTYGWIEDNKYGWYLNTGGATVSAEFDTSIKITGDKTLKFDCTINSGQYPNVSNTSVTAGATWAIGDMYKNGIKLKPNTKYKISLPIKGTISGGNFSISYATYNSTGTRINDFPNLETGILDKINIFQFTTGSTSEFLRIGFFYLAGVTGNLSIDINGMNLEEVVETTNNTLSTKSEAIQSLTAVGSYDNIDQSQLISSTTAILGNNTLKYLGQQIITEKGKYVLVVIRKGGNNGTYTGDVTVEIRTDNSDNPSSTVLTSYTIPNATWNGYTSGTDIEVCLPCTVSGKVWLTLMSSTTDDSNYTTIGKNSAGGYDGLFKYSPDSTTWTDSSSRMYFKTLYYKPTTNFKANLNGETIDLSADSDGFLDGSVIDLENGKFSFKEDFTNLLYLTNYTISGSDLICKVNLPSNILSGTFTSDKTLTYSTDNITYTNTIPTGVTTFYIKLASYSGITSFNFTINIDTSEIKKLYNYPTNKSILNTYIKTLTTATTTVTYRATKYGFPALEFEEGIYQYLKVNCSDSGSVVKLSEDGTTYVTKADGESLTITSTTLPIIYTDITIPYNRLLLSSNDYNADGEKDGSNQMKVVYKTEKQGTTYDIEDIQADINNIKTKLATL